MQRILIQARLTDVQAADQRFNLRIKRTNLTDTESAKVTNSLPSATPLGFYTPAANAIADAKTTYAG
jgi:hypothetical protein